MSYKIVFQPHYQGDNVEETHYTDNMHHFKNMIEKVMDNNNYRAAIVYDDKGTIVMMAMKKVVFI